MKKAPIRKIRTIHSVSEYTLTNGLRVLYKRESASPVVAVCVTFHVGSRNEAEGYSGATHLLEHLLFKDTEQYKKADGNAITDVLELFGSLLNASTSFDRTNYYELLPKEHLAEALHLEADRMRNAQFSAADLATEITVVRNEFERSRNNPFRLLEEGVLFEAYRKHPYRIPTIGYLEDIEQIQIERLRTFYDQFYWPNNATLTVIGDVSWDEVKKLLLTSFASIPRSPRPIPLMRITEPAQKKKRQCVMRSPMGITVAMLAYKIPPGTHKDYPALLLLSIILGGGFASRLQKALVDSGMAVALAVEALALRDPGLLMISAHVVDHVSPQEVLSAMREQIIETLRTLTPGEIRRAKERSLSSLATEHDGVLNEAYALSEAIATGDWRLAYSFTKSLRHITAKDIIRVGKKYLTKASETEGILLNQS